MSNVTQVTRYHGEFSSDMPQTEKMVKAKSLLPKEFENVARNSAALFVKYGETVYATPPEHMVPAESILVRSKTGQIYNIPAVSGGSI